MRDYTVFFFCDGSPNFKEIHRAAEQCALSHPEAYAVAKMLMHKNRNTPDVAHPLMFIAMADEAIRLREMLIQNLQAQVPIIFIEPPNPPKPTADWPVCPRCLGAVHPAYMKCLYCPLCGSPIPASAAKE